MLLGRGAETTRLDELIRDAAAGRGGALVIEGDPGVGKTALLEDAATSSATGANEPSRKRLVSGIVLNPLGRASKLAARVICVR